MSRSITSKFLLILVLQLPSVSWGAAAFVQQCGTGSTGSTSTTTSCTFGSNTTAGNAIVGYYAVNDVQANSITSIAGCGNTYSRPQTLQANSDTSTWFYAENIAGGACTITVTTSGAEPYRSMVVHEVSGVLTSGALDVSASQSVAGSTTTDSATSGAATTTANGDYIFGAMRVANTLTETVSAGTGFTGRVTGAGGADETPYRSEDKIQTSAGSIAATFTLTSADTVHVGMIALKASGGGGGGGSAPRNLLLMGVGQ